MRNVLFLLLFAPLAAMVNAGNPIDAITTALNSGDVETLSKYFAEQVEISIQNKEQVYTKAKATDVMRSFFDSNKPKSFSQIHRGTSRENSDQYCIGNLSAATGNYRVYIYVKMNGNVAAIQEMRMDKE